MKTTEGKTNEVAKELLERIEAYLKEELVGWVEKREENGFLFALPGGKKVRVSAEEEAETQGEEKNI